MQFYCTKINCFHRKSCFLLFILVYIICAQKELQKDKICYSFGIWYNTLEFSIWENGIQAMHPACFF